MSELLICCYGGLGGRVLMPSCNVRYETYSFYNQSNTPTAPPPPPMTASPSPPMAVNGARSGSGGRKKSLAKIIIIASVVGSAATALLLTGLGICCFKKTKYDAVAFENVSEDFASEESLQFEFNTHQAATNNFSNENLIGRGGFGSVYKGRLSNGQEIAVKRLSRSSGQGI